MNVTVGPWARDTPERVAENIVAEAHALRATMLAEAEALCEEWLAEADEEAAAILARAEAEAASIVGAAPPPSAPLVAEHRAGARSSAGGLLTRLRRRFRRS